MDDVPVVHSLCGRTTPSGEVPKKLIELGLWDNRGVILSVSIKCLGEPSKGATTCLVAGQSLYTWEQEELVITSREALKESSKKKRKKEKKKKINNFRSRTSSNQVLSPGAN